MARSFAPQHGQRPHRAGAERRRPRRIVPGLAREWSHPFPNEHSRTYAPKAVSRGPHLRGQCLPVGIFCLLMNTPWVLPGSCKNAAPSSPRYCNTACSLPAGGPGPVVRRTAYLEPSPDQRSPRRFRPLGWACAGPPPFNLPRVFPRAAADGRVRVAGHSTAPLPGSPRTTARGVGAGHHRPAPTPARPHREEEG